MTRMLLATSLAFLLPQGSGAAQVSHIETRLPPSHVPVSNAALDGRIARAAAQYRMYAPIPRGAFYDAAFPADSAEYVAMHGYLLVVVTTFAQDSSEVPPSRAYVLSAAGTTEVQLIAERASPVLDSTIRTTFGAHRSDGLYLLSVRTRASGGALFIDFGERRKGFRVTQLDEELPEEVRPLVALQIPSDLPDRARIWQMVRKEYPDLAIELQPR